MTWATFADTQNPMGLQAYEISVMRELADLDAVGWSFERRTVGSLRSDGDADVRIPLRVLERAPHQTALAIGRWAYRGSRSIHRFDLRLPPAAVPEVVTVHDLPPLRFADEGRLPQWSMSTARRARVIVCPSAFAADEVRELLNVERVVVIPNGVTSAPAGIKALSPLERRSRGLPAPRFVLHAGGATARKNLAALAQAWRGLAPHFPDCELVLAGPPDPRRSSLFAGMARVRLIGFQSRAEMPRLMASAACVVVPSLYEGFGLPALEAMSVGTPVVAAARGALPEVCGDAAVLCDPSPEGLLEGLRSVLSQESLRLAMRDRGRERAAAFTWQRSAKLHLEAYETYLT